MKEKRLLFSLIILALLVIGYCFRWTFVYKFDPVYWENFYYTSQWNVPNSKRIIGDEGVYRYIGYRLVNGENPFNVDYWVPPFGKYFYGFGAKFFGNPYWISWMWYAILLLILYTMTQNLWVLLLVATNPLIVSQVGLTMLDLPQGVFLLAHIALLLKKRIILSGIMLGIMFGIKIGYFVPFVALVGIYYLHKNNFSRKQIFIYLMAIPAGYMLSYFCYFVAHPNPIPWIRLHEKVFNFWKNSGTSAHPLNLIGYIFLNKFEQVWEGGRIWMISREWSILFPVSMLIIIKMWFSKINLKDKYLLILATTWLILSGMIDFWPRYLVAIVPILMIITVNYCKNNKLLLGVLFIINIINLMPVLRPNVEMEQSKLKNALSKVIDNKNTVTNEKFVTIVNPVRNRELWKDKSLMPIEKQYGAIRKYNLRATWLIQDDVFFDSELIAKIKSFDENQELGIFLEVTKNLALESRIYYDEQKPWYNPGVVFLSGYDISDRKKIIDTIVNNFYSVFGYYPKSVGAWWIDSYSHQYLENKYHIKTFMICADQRTTDSYGIWGQWWGYPYIPSRNNILVPGNSNTVVIQWAQRDLEKAYLGNGPLISNYSLQANDYINQGLNIKYFEKLANQYLSVNKLGQITVGLETGMESVGNEIEYEKQLKWISDSANQNKIVSLKMSDFGDKYRQIYNNKNPEKVVLGDWILTPTERNNLKLGEKTVYQKNMVFSDLYRKDDSEFLNRVYAPENLIKKKIIDIELIIKIVLIIVGFLVSIKFKKIKLWLIILIGIIVYSTIHIRFSIVNGEKIFGLLIDNFRFVGVNFKTGFINIDLSNVVAKSMIKLKFNELYYVYWILLGILIGKIANGRKNNKTTKD